MTILFATDFSDATNPDLTPKPFSVVTENSLSDLRYTADKGRDDSPGMEILFDGVGGTNNGEVKFGAVPLGQASLSIKLDVNVLNTLFRLGDDAAIMRVRNAAAANIFTLILQQNTAVNQYIGIQDHFGGTGKTFGTTDVQGRGWMTLEVVIKAPSSSVQVLLDGVEEVSAAPVGVEESATFARFGTVGGTVPDAGSTLYMDNLRISRSGYTPPGTGIGGSLNTPGASSQGAAWIM